MRKQGSLDGIILLVISFSVINYGVSKSVRLRQADSLFFVPTGTKKEKSNPRASRCHVIDFQMNDGRRQMCCRLRASFSRSARSESVLTANF